MEFLIVQSLGLFVKILMNENFVQPKNTFQLELYSFNFMYKSKPKSLFIWKPFHELLRHVAICMVLHGWRIEMFVESSPTADWLHLPLERRKKQTFEECSKLNEDAFPQVRAFSATVEYAVQYHFRKLCRYDREWVMRTVRKYKASFGPYRDRTRDLGVISTTL